MRGHTVATGQASRSTRARSALHAVAGVASWIALILLGAWRFGSDAPAHAWTAVLGIGVYGIAFAAIGVAWIAWNRNIYRRRHRRTSAITTPVAFTHDTTGRQIAASPGIQEASGTIIVDVDPESGRKTYRSAGRAQLGGRAA